MRWLSGRKRRFAKVARESRNGPEIDDFRPVFYVRQAWRAAPCLALSTDSESESGSDVEVKVLWGP